MIGVSKRESSQRVEVLGKWGNAHVLVKLNIAASGMAEIFPRSCDEVGGNGIRLRIET